MIARISGTIVEKGPNYLLISTGGFTYEVFIPVTVMQRLPEFVSPDKIINLITYHYLQVDQSKSIPILIGFVNQLEKEFFENFITVSGIGPRAALKALNQPISLIAQAIDEANVEFLKSLPGIGQQRAKEIIAKLQNKIGKFGLIQDSTETTKPTVTLPMEEEALAVLMQLEYKKPEACVMLKKALLHNKNIKTTEELLNEVYKQRKIR
ncbi:MAG: Holliday junction branch migration protein RuvA [Candidatus Omnitrophota bacterium]|jgi:Holliday junction DNA helicase RuvA